MNKINNSFLFVCEYKSIYGGNFIPSLIALANKIKNKKNMEVLFLFPEAAKNRQWISFIISCGYKVYYFDTQHGAFSKMRAIKKVIKLLRPSYVYSHFLSPFLIKMACLSNKKTKLIIHLHSDFSAGHSISFKGRIKSLLENSIRKNAIYISVSESLLKRRSIKNGHFVPNPLCLQRVPCNIVSRQEMRASLNLTDDDYLFLLFCWSPFVKGLDIAVKAIETANKLNEKIKLLCVCGYDGGIEKNKKYIFEKTAIDPDSRFLLFTEPNEDVFRFHKAADCFLSCSRSEGFSYALLEALYVGLPCIISDIPSTNWATDFKPLVSVFESGNSDMLSDFVFSQSKKAKMIDNVNTIPIINSRYNLEKWVETIMTIIYE